MFSKSTPLLRSEASKRKELSTVDEGSSSKDSSPSSAGEKSKKPPSQPVDESKKCAEAPEPKESKDPSTGDKDAKEGGTQEDDGEEASEAAPASRAPSPSASVQSAKTKRPPPASVVSDGKSPFPGSKRVEEQSGAASNWRNQMPRSRAHTADTATSSSSKGRKETFEEAAEPETETKHEDTSADVSQHAEEPLPGDEASASFKSAVGEAGSVNLSTAQTTAESMASTDVAQTTAESVSTASVAGDSTIDETVPSAEAKVPLEASSQPSSGYAQPVVAASAPAAPQQPTSSSAPMERSTVGERPQPPMGPRPDTVLRRKTERDKEIEDLRSQLAAMKAAMATAGLPVEGAHQQQPTPRKNIGEVFPTRRTRDADPAAREAAGKVLASLMDDNAAAWDSTPTDTAPSFRPMWSRSMQRPQQSAAATTAAAPEESREAQGGASSPAMAWGALSEEEKIKTLRQRPPGFFVWSTQAEDQSKGKSAPPAASGSAATAAAPRIVPNRARWGNGAGATPAAAAPRTAPSPYASSPQRKLLFRESPGSGHSPSLPQPHQQETSVTRLPPRRTEELVPKPSTASFSPSTRSSALSHPALSHLKEYLGSLDRLLQARAVSQNPKIYQPLTERKRLMSWLSAGAALRLAPACASLLKRVSEIRNMELQYGVREQNTALVKCRKEAEEELNRAISYVSDLESTTPSAYAVRAGVGDLYGSDELQFQVDKWRTLLTKLGDELEYNAIVDPRSSLATIGLAKNFMRKMAEDSWNEAQMKARSTIQHTQVLYRTTMLEESSKKGRLEDLQVKLRRLEDDLAKLTAHAEEYSKSKREEMTQGFARLSRNEQTLLGMGGREPTAQELASVELPPSLTVAPEKRESLRRVLAMAVGHVQDSFAEDANEKLANLQAKTDREIKKIQADADKEIATLREKLRADSARKADEEVQRMEVEKGKHLQEAARLRQKIQDLEFCFQEKQQTQAGSRTLKQLRVRVRDLWNSQLQNAQRYNGGTSQVRSLARDQVQFLGSCLRNAPFSYEYLHALRRTALQLGITGKLSPWPSTPSRKPQEAQPPKPPTLSQTPKQRPQGSQPPRQGAHQQPQHWPIRQQQKQLPLKHGPSKLAKSKAPMFSPVQHPTAAPHAGRAADQAMPVVAHGPVSPAAPSTASPEITIATPGAAQPGIIGSASSPSAPQAGGSGSPPLKPKRPKFERSVSFDLAPDDDAEERDTLLNNLRTPATPSPGRLSVRSSASNGSASSRVLKPWHVKTITTPTSQGSADKEPSAPLDQFMASQQRGNGASVLSVRTGSKKPGINRYVDSLQDAGEALHWALHEPFDLEQDIETVFSLQQPRVEAEEQRSRSPASRTSSRSSSPRRTYSRVGGGGTLYEGSIRAAALGPMYMPQPGIHTERQDNTGEAFAKSLRVPQQVLSQQRRIEEEHHSQRAKTGGRWIDVLHRPTAAGDDEYAEVANPLHATNGKPTPKSSRQKGKSTEAPKEEAHFDPSLMFYRQRKRLAGRRSLLMRHFREAQDLEEDERQRQQEAEEERKRQIRIMARTGYGTKARGLLAHSGFDEEDDGDDAGSAGTRATRTLIMEGSAASNPVALNPPRPKHSAWADILNEWDGNQ